MNYGTISVLIVEDNPGDVFMIKEMLHDLQMDLNISVAKDGQLAMDMMKDQNNVLPGLMILDLNLPRLSGFEVLRLMKASPTLSPIPVVVMTGSLRKKDEQKSRELGAIDYCMKPATFEEIERSKIELRAHLESVPRSQRNGAASGPSFKMTMNNFHLVCRVPKAPTLHQDRFMMDGSDNGFWIPWK
jgi:CheY-like chemotaxis protein